MREITELESARSSCHARFEQCALLHKCGSKNSFPAMFLLPSGSCHARCILQERVPKSKGWHRVHCHYHFQAKPTNWINIVKEGCAGPKAQRTDRGGRYGLRPAKRTPETAALAPSKPSPESLTGLRVLVLPSACFCTGRSSRVWASFLSTGSDSTGPR